MNGCCGEYKCHRKKPVLVRRAMLSGRWMVVTDYKEMDNGIIRAITKHDVTEDLTGYLLSLGWTPPEELA